MHSFRLPELSRTRTTCVVAAHTILHHHEKTQVSGSSGDAMLTTPIWTHSAFCFTAATIIGLDLLYREDHIDDEAQRLRLMVGKAAERLRQRQCEVITHSGAALIDVILATEEELVLRLMQASSIVQTMHSESSSWKIWWRTIRSWRGSWLSSLAARSMPAAAWLPLRNNRRCLCGSRTAWSVMGE